MLTFCGLETIVGASPTHKRKETDVLLDRQFENVARYAAPLRLGDANTSRTELTKDPDTLCSGPEGKDEKGSASDAAVVQATADKVGDPDAVACSRTERPVSP